MGVEEQEFAFMEPRSRCLGKTEAFFLNQYPFREVLLVTGKTDAQRDSSLKSQNVWTMAMARDCS